MITAELIGQIVGFVAVALGFVSFQMRTQKQLLVVQFVTTLTFCLHYYLIGATSGLVLNLLGAVRNLAYYYREKPLFSGKKCPIFFALLMGVAGVLTWQGAYSLFVVAGLVINTICLSFAQPQKIRASILVTSPLVLVYDVFVSSFGGVIYESVVIVSSIIGLLRFRKQQVQA